MRIRKQYSLGPNPLQTKVIPIGVWDMDSTSQVSIAHGLTFADIRKASAFVYDDTSTVAIPLDSDYTLLGVTEGKVVWNATDIVLTRINAGYFDTVNYDDAVMNRGFIVVEYV